MANAARAVVYEPPPNPADWICDRDMFCQTTGPQDGPLTASQPLTEPHPWAALIAFRSTYRARHGVATRY